MTRNVRATTVSYAEMRRQNRGVDEPASTEARPRTRGGCLEGQGRARPCPWVGCKFHLYLDVNPETGSIKLNFPGIEPEEMKVSCALDVAMRGGVTLEEVGEIMNLTRERIRQVEVRGLLALKRSMPDPGEVGKSGDHFLPGFY